jgi:iron complex outermembrane receptor protein
MGYLLLPLVIMVTFPAIAQTVKLTGKVVDQATEEPLPGAVIFIHETSQHATSDPDGTFAFEGMKPGNYHIHVSYVGYQAIDKDIRLYEDMEPLLCAMSRSYIELGQINVEEDLVKSTLRQRPLNIEVVDKQYLEENLESNLANTLTSLPGMASINTGTGIGKPVIRGLSFNRVVVNNKGIKQEGQQWGSDHGLEVDQHTIGKIELIKGPASLLYGSDAMGGVLNLLPPAIPAKNSLTGELQGQWASVNQQRSTTAMVQGNYADVFLRGRFSYQRFNDFKVPAENFTYNTYLLPIANGRLKNTAGKERTVSASAGIRRNWGNLQVHFADFYQQAGLFTGAIGIPRGYQLEDDGDPTNIDIPRQTNRHQSVTLNGKLLYADSWLHFDVGYQRSLRREESFPHLHGSGPAPDGNLALLLDLKTYAANMRYHHFFKENVKSIFGLSAQHQNHTYGGFEFLVPAYRNTSAGAYYFTEYTHSAVSVISGGLRYDYGTIHADRHLQPIYENDSIVDHTVRVPAISRQFHNVSGSIGWSWFPNEFWNLKFNFGKTFRMPNPAELGSNGVHHGTFRHERGDPSLSSEHGFQLDAGIYYQRRKLLVKASPYFNYFKNYIFLRPSGQFSLLPDAGQVYQYEQSDAIHTGLEATIDHHPMEQLHLELGAAYTGNYNLETYLPLPFTPPFNTQFLVDYKFLEVANWLKTVKVSSGIAYYAPQNRTDRNEPPTPGYALWDAHASFKFQLGKNQLAILQVWIKNILNTRYLKHLSRYRILNLPEPGRNFTVALRLPLHFVGDR